MRAQRRLVLHQETLTELRSAELASVGGGQDSPLSRIVTCIDIVRPSGNLPLCQTLFEPCSHGCPPLP